MIQATFDDKGLSLRLAQAPQVTSLQLQKWMTLFMARMHASVAANIGQGGFIGRRSGNLARSLKDEVTVGDSTVVGRVWPDPLKAAYGRVQEDGGTIIPKKSRFLTIPLAAMLTANGVARGNARDVIQNPSAFGYKSTFFHKGVLFGVPASGARRRGLQSLIGAKTRDAVVPLFALKSSVTLPGRHYLEGTLKQELQFGMELLERITGETTELIFQGI